MKSPAFQFYAENFLAGTADMTAEEVGVYIRMLCYQWHKGALPDDDRKLMNITGGRRGALAEVKRKFTLTADGLQNERLEQTRQDQEAYRESRRENALKRWGKRDGDRGTKDEGRKSDGGNTGEQGQTLNAETGKDHSRPSPPALRPQAPETTSARLWRLHAITIDAFMANKYRTLDRASIFKKLDEDYPAPYPFRDANHLLNCFKKIAEQMLQPSPKSFTIKKNNHARKPGQQHHTGDYDRYRAKDEGRGAGEEARRQ